MKCEQVIEAAQRALDHESSAAMPDAAVRHLEQCAACRTELQSLAELHAALVQRGASREPLPQGFHARFVSRLSNEPIHRPLFLRRRRSWIGGAAAGIAATATLMVALPRQPALISSDPPAQLSQDALMHSPASGEELVASLEKLGRLDRLDLAAAVPTPTQIYTSIGAEVSDLTISFRNATTLLADSLAPDDNEPIDP